jgi:uracil phosphoribosyltransferase
MIVVLDHPLVHYYTTILRDEATNSSRFREVLKKIGYHLAIECLKFLNLEEIQVKTPKELITGFNIFDDVVYLPIIRAGIILLNSFQEVYPKASTGYIVLQRDDNNFETHEYYFSLPPINLESKIIILDVQIATGNTICSTLTRLQLEGAENITVVSVIASPEGIENIASKFPNVNIIIATLDTGLDAKGLIIPGIGDSGDRINNTLHNH